IYFVMLRYPFLIFVMLILSLSAGTRTYGQANVRKPPVRGVRIAWDFRSIQQLAPRNNRNLSYAGYPRVKRFSDGRAVAVYEAEGNGELIQTVDNEKQWSDPKMLFKA